MEERVMTQEEEREEYDFETLEMEDQITHEARVSDTYNALIKTAGGNVRAAVPTAHSILDDENADLIQKCAAEMILSVAEWPVVRNLGACA